MKQVFGDRHTNNSVLVLQGGIGNQLFQINTCLKSNPENLLLIQTNRSLKEFSWESRFIQPKTMIRQANDFQQYVGGVVGRYILHLNFKPTFLEKNKLLVRLIYFILKIIVFIVCLKWLKFIVDSENEIQFQNSNYFVCGYFHNQKISIDFKSKSVLTPTSESDEFKYYLELIQMEKPICVHIRRGDYLINSQFRILSEDYYDESLAFLNNQFITKSIWVFSDSIDEARELMSDHSSYNIRYIDSVGKSDFESLELMRHAQAFVVANSTFSVWSAILAYDSKAPVIIPVVWFNSPSLNTDRRLSMQIPTHWTCL